MLLTMNCKIDLAKSYTSAKQVTVGDGCKLACRKAASHAHQVDETKDVESHCHFSFPSMESAHRGA